jgi:biopolymer transport protein ExbB
VNRCRTVFHLSAYVNLSMDQIAHIILSGLGQLSEGGPILIPLVAFSLCSHTIIMERAYHLRRRRIIPSHFVTRSIYHELVEGNPEIAIKMCEKKPGPLTNILRAGIEHRDAGEDTIKRVIRIAITTERRILTRYLNFLGLLASVSLYTGLLGTVVGMIYSFGALYVGKPTDIAVGISQALLTTAAGLVVALPAYVANDYFRSKSQNFVTALERHGMSLVRFLTTEEYKLFQGEFEDIRDYKEDG